MLVGGGMFGKEAVDGLNDQGDPISLVRDAEGEWQYGAAIWQDQTGRLTPETGRSPARREELSGARDVLGKLRRLPYSHITQGIFKPLVLLTPSYASTSPSLRSSRSVARRRFQHGRAGIDVNIAKLGVRAGDSAMTPTTPGRLRDWRGELVSAGCRVLPSTDRRRVRASFSRRAIHRVQRWRVHRAWGRLVTTPTGLRSPTGRPDNPPVAPRV